MSLFNLRRSGQSSKSTAAQSAPAESLDIVRKRAKHRLIGSAVLVVLGVIGFPLLFDTQPRPVAVGLSIEIPSKQSVKPLNLPPAVDTPAPEPTSAVAAALSSDRLASPASLETPKALPAKADTPSAAKEVAMPQAASAAQTPEKSSAPAAKPQDEAVRAKALLEGSPPAAAQASAFTSPAAAALSSELRLVVQVGAFADAAKAREARLKLERAGLKTYTQVAETKDGKRIRVRVGPYASKAEADKAAQQIKALKLPAAILTL